jgi:hypothetical protein
LGGFFANSRPGAFPHAASFNLKPRLKKRKHKNTSARAKAGDRMLREMQWQQWNMSNQGLILLASLLVCATLKLCESRCSAGVKLQEKRLNFEKRGFARGGA